MKWTGNILNFSSREENNMLNVDQSTLWRLNRARRKVFNQNFNQEHPWLLLNIYTTMLGKGNMSKSLPIFKCILLKEETQLGKRWRKSCLVTWLLISLKLYKFRKTLHVLLNLVLKDVFTKMRKSYLKLKLNIKLLIY